MEKTRRILQFEKIKEQLCNFTLTIPGAQAVAALNPLSDMRRIIELQEETSEAVGIILGGNLDFKGCGDLLPLLLRAERGGLLNPAELKEIELFVRALETVKNPFIKDNELAKRFPRMAKLVMSLKIFPHILSQLERCLTSQGEVRPDASPQLVSLHTEEKRLQEKIRRLLEAYLRSPQYQKYLQENIFTVRNDRYVLPIKQEYRNQFPGVVHDQSASGVTLFIEPLSVLEINNRLRTVQGRIEEEIEKILRKLTALIAEYSPELISSYRLYGELDFILARGQLSLAHMAREPLINNRGYIAIKGGRHPLLSSQDVVPIDVYLGGDFNTLVITGPNTGGKTVTLKTIGLFSLMASCGLHIPAEAGTELTVFEGIWADIGDEQDIEQSLSTFSGHMTNIIEILRKCRPPSLVLLDELGSGTDPSEGAALAMAILHELHSRDVRTVATTHINDLKVFAHLNEGMENASMEFDPHTLRPTFRLLIGVPGQSNALTVAGKLGMPPELIAKARSFMRKEFLDLEEVVSGLVQEKYKLSRDSEKMAAMKSELGLYIRELQEEKRGLEQKRRDILKKALEDAHEIVRTAQIKTAEILKKLHQAEREKQGKDALVLAEKSRKEMKNLLTEYRQQESFKEPDGKPLQLHSAKEGQIVYVKSLRCPAEIMKVLSDKEILVRAGTLKVNTTLGDLQEYENNNDYKDLEKKKKVSARGPNLMWEKSATVSQRLDLRGLTLEEAVLKVEKHLDDALLAGLHRIELIHGKGTGKLREGLQLYLQEHKNIQSYRLGVQGEGGSGVTIVHLKQ